MEVICGVSEPGIKRSYSFHCHQRRAPANDKDRPTLQGHLRSPSSRQLQMGTAECVPLEETSGRPIQKSQAHLLPQNSEEAEW